MFMTTKGIKHFYSHIYLDLSSGYYSYMINKFLLHVGMYHYNFDLDIMLKIQLHTFCILLTIIKHHLYHIEFKTGSFNLIIHS